LASMLGPKGRAYVESRFDYDRLTAVLETRITMLLEERNRSSDNSMESTNTAAASSLR
jgi:hypothetical protein